LSVQVVQQPDDLTVSNKLDYWAQGGVSMSLRQEAGWGAQALSERMPFFEDKRLRSAVVYDTKGMLYLIVSTSKAAVPEFRQAILESVGGGRLVAAFFWTGTARRSCYAGRLS
jgi:hypothetical protein